MIKFPDSTLVNKVVPKTAFYKHLEVNASMKEHFVNDVDRIVWAYKLAPSTLNVTAGKAVQELTVFAVTLKNKNCPSDVFVFIDKNLPRHTVFVLSFEGEQSVLINYKEQTQGNAAMPFKVTKTYQSPWMSKDSATLIFEGASLDLIYENMVRQIAGSLIIGESNDLKEDIESSQEQEQLKKEIAALKSKIRLERQPQKKFVLHKKLKELESQLIK
jgi:hypothetical protein